ncbi:uncharacterized protein MYCFIDRAFT_172580 [Pseudocercospora fijiensis CIRAD86]|uniref:Uncharacterized protein n=1 Tax=Pseudocercospora fijiensis (strain CIRAD86) TaxID=383855 RepID=M3A720_PSEFD|nr:uncharacterized protein MYCFIDRAFT_172580 [Pseudocercospora fijiensis CIRAD86]EME86884.1 hypothetical protein MYCFIDRAFT_172580 [Pseudocercospora fijiensis CIRAD86]
MSLSLPKHHHVHVLGMRNIQSARDGARLNMRDRTASTSDTYFPSPRPNRWINIFEYTPECLHTPWAEAVPCASAFSIITLIKHRMKATATGRGHCRSPRCIVWMFAKVCGPLPASLVYLFFMSLSASYAPLTSSAPAMPCRFHQHIIGPHLIRSNKKSDSRELMHDIERQTNDQAITPTPLVRLASVDRSRSLHSTPHVHHSGNLRLVYENGGMPVVRRLTFNLLDLSPMTNYPEDWSPVPQKISTRPANYEPRDARASLPKNSDRALRPKPLNLPSKQPQDSSVLKSVQSLRQESTESSESLRDPEIVDVGSTTQWTRRDHHPRRSKRVTSRSTASQYSARQSEISLGILDYYMRDRTPSLHSPELPPPTPRLDPAIAELDFGELPPTPTPSAAPTPALPSRHTGPYQEAKGQPLIPLSPPSAVRPSATLTRGYSLFPVIKEVTPPPRHPEITHIPPITLRDITPTSVKSTPSIPSHPSSDPIHRPRKESISSSVRTRNDSINSCRAKQRYPIPLRILSSDSTTTTPPANHRRLISTSTATTSPPAEPQSRWSDDTIASPSLAPTPGPRTSFGSLLRRDSQQYPACFFEDDDDEEAPLRRKWAWKTSVNSVSTGRDSKMSTRKLVKGKYDEVESPRPCFWQLILYSYVYDCCEKLDGRVATQIAESLKSSISCLYSYRRSFIRLCGSSAFLVWLVTCTVSCHGHALFARACAFLLDCHTLAVTVFTVVKNRFCAQTCMQNVVSQRCSQIDDPITHGAVSILLPAPLPMSTIMTRRDVRWSAMTPPRWRGEATAADNTAKSDDDEDDMVQSRHRHTPAAKKCPIRRVTTSPYPTQLRTLRDLVLQCSDADISQWAAAKPCDIPTLASCLLEGLQQWPYVLEIIAKFACNITCRDAFLHHEPTLLHSVVAQSVKSGDLRSKYARASVALLSTPLPDTIALPADAQTLFINFVENAARSPSAATIEPVYLILHGTGNLLLGVLSSHVLAKFEEHLLDILRNVSGTSALSLYCLSIMNTVCCSMDPEFRLTNSSYNTQDFLASTPASSRWKSEAMQQFFTGSKAQKSTQLVVLLVLWATKTETIDSWAEKTKALVLSLEVLSAIPVDLRKIWCTGNPMLVRKLQERLCSEELASAHKTLALRFIGMLCELDSLPHPVVESLETTFLEAASMQAVHTLCPHLDHSELLSSILIRAPISMLLESAVDVATRAESVELNVSLDAVTTTIAQAQIVIGSQKIAVHQIRQLLNNEEFLARLERLSSLLSRPSTTQESTSPAGWCEKALSRSRCKLAHQISNLFLWACQTASVGAQAMTVLLDLHASSARGDLPCSHERPSWRDELTFGEDNGDQNEHDDLDWREALHTHFRARAQVEQDAVTRLFTKACANLEARCEDVERPLREEQRRCKAAEDRNAKLVQAFAELETRYMDLTSQNRTLEEDRKQHFKELEACQESLDAAERRGDETFQRVSHLEKQLREANEAGKRQIAEMNEAKQIVEVNGAARLAQKQEQLEDAQDEVAALKTRYDNEAVRASNAEQNLAAVQVELDKTKRELATSTSAAQRLHLDMERLQLETQQLNASNTALEEQLAKTSESDATKMQEMAELRDELQTCQAERGRLQSEAVRQMEEMQHELEQKRREADRLASQYSEDTERLHGQVSGLQQDLLQTRDSLSAEIESRNAKVADYKKRLERYQKKCEQKDQQIAEAESMRVNLMAAMGIRGTQNRASLPHRSRESVAPALVDTQSDASPPTPTSSSNMDVDASSVDQSFASNASNEPKNGSTPKRPRPRKSLSFAAPLTTKPRASNGLRTSRTSIATRQSMGRQALQGISGNRPSLTSKTPVKEVQKEVGAEEEASTFEGSELFIGTQEQHLQIEIVEWWYGGLVEDSKTSEVLTGTRLAWRVAALAANVSHESRVVQIFRHRGVVKAGTAGEAARPPARPLPAALLSQCLFILNGSSGSVCSTAQLYDRHTTEQSRI